MCEHLVSTTSKGCPYTEDLYSLTIKFSHSLSSLLEIINAVAWHIEDTWGFLLEWDHKGIVSPATLQVYANTLTNFGSPGKSIIGFLDCTIRQTCCPSINKSMAYTGYKKYNRMKFQAIVLPNGLIGHLSGPYCAPQNDAGILAASHLVDTLAKYAIQQGSQEGDPPSQCYFQVYADSAYSISPHILSPFVCVGELMPEETQLNKVMGSVHISVKHSFGLVLQDWLYHNAFWKQKIYDNACCYKFILIFNGRDCQNIILLESLLVCGTQLVIDACKSLSRGNLGV